MHGSPTFIAAVYALWQDIFCREVKPEPAHVLQVDVDWQRYGRYGSIVGENGRNKAASRAYAITAALVTGVTTKGSNVCIAPICSIASTRL
jgi:hypothetical protein